MIQWFFDAESLRIYVMLKYNNEARGINSGAAFSNMTNDVLVLEFDVFLTSQENTLSFLSTFLLHSSTCNACISLPFFSLLAWLITKDMVPKSFVQLPTKELFVTSNSNILAGCFPHSHSLVPPSLKPQVLSFQHTTRIPLLGHPLKTHLPTFTPSFCDSSSLTLTENPALPTCTTCNCHR